MKSLALSVACAISLASPGVCGDLGRADIATRNQNITSTTFSANCIGSFDSPKGPECLVEFLDNKLSVDSSSGITSDQIVSVSQSWHPSGYFINLQYVDSTGASSLAQFSFIEKSVANDFLNALTQFMSGSMTTPVSTQPEEVVETEEVVEAEEVVETEEADPQESSDDSIKSES